MGIIGSLFGPKKGPRDFNCARVHRGVYVADTNEYARGVEVGFRILHGEAVIKRGRPLSVYEPDPRRFTKLETFYIFPQSPWVRVELKNSRGSRSIFLWREEDRQKSRMFKMRL